MMASLNFTCVEFQNLGVISGHNKTIESAVTKLMYLLGEYTLNETKELLHISLR